ncbi:MAG: hypothetical protein IJ503_05305 [Akkermansia sp.]|nr:hypothetical protein [Akkermansia sp.]
MITKYFPDKTYDGEEGSLAAAIAMRDDIINTVAANPANAKKIMQELKNRYCGKKRKKRKA